MDRLKVNKPALFSNSNTQRTEWISIFSNYSGGPPPIGLQNSHEMIVPAHEGFNSSRTKRQKR